MSSYKEHRILFFQSFDCRLSERDLIRERSLTVLLVDLGRVSSRTGPWSSSTSPNSKDTNKGSLKSGRGWDRKMRKRTHRGKRKRECKQTEEVRLDCQAYLFQTKHTTDWKLSESFIVTNIRCLLWTTVIYAFNLPLLHSPGCRGWNSGENVYLHLWSS